MAQLQDMVRLLKDTVRPLMDMVALPPPTVLRATAGRQPPDMADSPGTAVPPDTVAHLLQDTAVLPLQDMAVLPLLDMVVLPLLRTAVLLAMADSLHTVVLQDTEALPAMVPLATMTVASPLLEERPLPDMVATAKKRRRRVTREACYWVLLAVSP